MSELRNTFKSINPSVLKLSTISRICWTKYFQNCPTSFQNMRVFTDVTVSTGSRVIYKPKIEQHSHPTFSLFDMMCSRKLTNNKLTEKLLQKQYDLSVELLDKNHENEMVESWNVSWHLEMNNAVYRLMAVGLVVMVVSLLDLYVLCAVRYFLLYPCLGGVSFHVIRGRNWSPSYVGRSLW